MFLGQPCSICIGEVDFDLKGSETDAAGISLSASRLLIINDGE